jgi:hypothetical protein
MEPKVLKALKHSAKLARDVHPMLEKLASCRNKASFVSDALVASGFIEIEKRAGLERDLEDPEFAYDLIVKLAEFLTPDTFGSVGEKHDPSSGLTPEERFLNRLMG